MRVRPSASVADAECVRVIGEAKRREGADLLGILRAKQQSRTSSGEQQGEEMRPDHVMFFTDAFHQRAQGDAPSQACNAN